MKQRHYMSFTLFVIVMLAATSVGDNVKEVFRMERVYQKHPLGGEISVPLIVAWDTGIVFRLNSATNWSHVNAGHLMDRIRGVESEVWSRDVALQRHQRMSWIGPGSFLRVTAGKVVLESWHPLMEATGDCVISGATMYPVKSADEQKRVQGAWSEEYRWFRDVWRKGTNIVNSN